MPNPSTYIDCPCCGYKKALCVSMKEGELYSFCFAGCGIVSMSEKASTYRIDQKEQGETFYNSDYKRRIAQKLWNKALVPQGTAVEAYLLSRGLTGSIPDSIRFLPNHIHKGSQTSYPVMLAKVSDVYGSLRAVHRTYLNADGSCKALVIPSKMTLGTVKGFGCVLAPLDRHIAISEGIETGLSVQQSTGLPTLAALNAGNMAEVMLPPLPIAKKITIAVDSDEAGMRAALKAKDVWLRQGRMVCFAVPPKGMDFNDLLLERARK